MAKKKQHGGKREGAGKPKGIRYTEETVVRRIPISILAKVDELIAAAKEKFKKLYGSSEGR